MSEFSPKSICILGRQPALGLAELESLYGAGHLKPGSAGTALLDIEAFDINFKNLGGTVKVARILTELPDAGWAKALKYLRTTVPQHLVQVPAGKFTLGVSLYGFDENAAKLSRDLLWLKKAITASGRSVRLVPNNTLALSSAQVLHNKLTQRGAWELVLVKNGKKAILAQTVFVQDIEAYAARDQVRPARDSRVGMLPPKLAQIVINLARPPKNEPVLDPFCGTGVILQEALLMGCDVTGTDIEPRMVEYSSKNLDWLAGVREIKNKYKIGQADATFFKWPPFGTVASELYLGRPLTKLPDPGSFKQIITDTNTIAKKFLINLAPQLKAGQRICIAIPAWIDGQKAVHLPLIDHLTDMGYNRYDFVHVKNADLLYYREGQIVARELLVLTKV